MALKKVKGDVHRAAATPPPELLVVDAQLPQVPPFVFARMAQEASGTAEAVLALLDKGPQQPSRAHELLANLAKTGLQAQRCARVLGGDYLPRREQISLDLAIQHALAAAGPAGCNMVATDLHAVKVWIDASVLALLLELALDWAADVGSRIGIRIAFGDETLHPDIVLTVASLNAPASPQQGDVSFMDTMQWLLLRLLAQSQMIDPQRIVEGQNATLVLRFPPVLTGQGGSPPMQLSPGAPAGGCHVIVVDKDDNLRFLMRQLLHDAGIVVEAFVSPRQAEDMSQHFLAEVIVSGYAPDDPDALALLAVMRQKNPAVRVIQLTEEDFLYIGPDGSAEAARLGRASVRQALVQAVLLSVGIFAKPTLAALQR